MPGASHAFACIDVQSGGIYIVEYVSDRRLDRPLRVLRLLLYHSVRCHRPAQKF